MAVPSSFMSSLDGLTNISLMDIQPLGLHDGLVHYSVRIRVENRKKVETFVITVDLKKEQINIKNPSEQLIFTSYGGLKQAKEIMSVYSALNYFRGPILTVCGNELLDKTEGNSSLQLSMFYNQSRDSFSIKENKNLHIPNPAHTYIFQHREISAITITLNYNIPEELSPLKKALILMATLKLTHYHYSFHRHLMPSDIPHLMPPGTPKEPLSVLGSMSEIVMRPSCVNKQTNSLCSDLLDGDTFTTLLVVEQNLQKAEKSVNEFFFRDQFGVLQFGAELDLTTFHMDVYDSKKSVFCTYGGASSQFCLFGNDVMFLKSIAPYDSSHHPKTNVYEIRSKTSHAVLARFHMMKEWRMIKLNMDSDLPVHWKAAIIANTAIVAALNIKIWTKTTKPFTYEYLFRAILK